MNSSCCRKLDKDYEEKLQIFRELLKKNDDELWDLMDYLLKNNSFENAMDRISAERLIEYQQRCSLNAYGGWPLWKEISFKVNGEEYTVIAYGASDENEGKDALLGMVFVKEDEESNRLRKWGRFESERDFVRFKKYLEEVKKGLREPNGVDEFGIVPDICEKCKKEQATIYSSRGSLCRKCDQDDIEIKLKKAQEDIDL